MSTRRTHHHVNLNTKKKRARKSTRLGCKGKVRYRDQQEALGALHRISNGDRRQKTPGRTYFCESCRGWHLSSASDHARSGITKVDRFDKHRRIE